MFCKNCGKELPDGVKFCTNCGATVDGAQNDGASGQTTYTGTVNGGNANAPKNRNIGVCILLSIVTCGIYGIVWLVQMVDELNAAANDPNATSGIRETEKMFARKKKKTLSFPSKKAENRV